MTLLFSDISQFQTGVDWTKVQLPLVFARASEGISFVDSSFATFRARAAGRGIPFGAYHFLDWGNGATQAQHFLAQLGSLDQYFGFQLDIESHTLVAQDVTDFMTEWRRHTDRPIFQYGPEGVLAKCSGAKWGPMWLANYPGGGYPGDASPIWRISFGGWASPTLWQYGPTSDPGFPHIIDGDAFRGTLPELAALMGASDMSLENTFTPFVADFTAGGTLYKDAARTQVDTNGWVGGTDIGVFGVSSLPLGTFPDAAVGINLSQPGTTTRKLVYIGANHIVPGSLRVRPSTIFPVGFTQADIDAAVAAQKATDAAAASAILNAAVAKAASDQKAKDIAAVQGA